VIVTDAGGLRTSAAITVAVGDINDVVVDRVESYSVSSEGGGLSTRGGEVVTLHGVNLGRADGSDGLAVTYGATGAEYAAVCVFLSNVALNCTTVPGSGGSLVWRVAVDRSGHAAASAPQSGPVGLQIGAPATIKSYEDFFSKNMRKKI